MATGWMKNGTAVAAVKATALVMLLATHNLALASGGFQKVEDVGIDLQDFLLGFGVVVVTVAIMIAAFKIMFKGASFGDVVPVLVGGALFGAASALAGFLTTQA